MVTLINPPGIKSLSSIQMQTPNLPVGLAYIAGILRENNVPCTVIDAVGLALDSISPYPDRSDFLIQGLTEEEIVRRIPIATDIVGFGCMFSTLWPVTRRLVARVRRAFPHALLVLGGEHGTAVPEHSLTHSALDVVVLGEGERTFLALLRARRLGTPFHDTKGIAFKEGDRIVYTGLSERLIEIDAIPWPDWESFPVEAYIGKSQSSGMNLGRFMPILATRGCPYR
ncbi:MAG: cobalamin-dependent protein, partial [Magnetococcales bacterium]|nr:cobalamin-dependent protein [Magnetococcales bacterium]